jgi:hypothetical protein
LVLVFKTNVMIHFCWHKLAVFCSKYVLLAYFCIAMFVFKKNANVFTKD